MIKYLISLLLLCTSVHADEAIKRLMETHLKKYADTELFSAIQVSVKHQGKIESYAVGTRERNGKEPITTNDLFDIGSITKSFTASLAVMAESEGKIDLDKPLKTYLENYPHWGELSLTSLLDMSSGIPNYSDSATFNFTASHNLKKFWSQDEILNIVYSKDYNPPIKKGYFYSNTGYVLMDKILEKAHKKDLATQLQNKIIKPLNLKNTFYPVPSYPKEVLSRMVRGYSFNVYDNPELLGKDVTENNLSWAGAAGALLANSEDVVRWASHLFTDDNFLSPAQRKRMQTMISVATAKPITQVSKEDPRGFGLGIVQAYNKNLGLYWFYEGETLGYRAVYVYVPEKQIIISAMFNSATNPENDHAHELLMAIFNYYTQDSSTD